ncbi:MAG TPA: zinc-binding dehydrogenase [Gemmatimonadaceae bacterium]|jgi:NADPH:quinone reductase-like Zn-dependent oxidoreductase|nr:zinc-binding dehydrogenase [Gemmatimonadaceae bacterium]
MRALTISAHGGLDRIEVRSDLAPPEIQRPADVRIRVRSVGLNHLDLFVVEGLPGVTIKPPWILGGDAYGVVESVGDAVKSVVPGDHVVVNAGLSDRTCEYCRAGEQPLCPRFGLLGEHHPGTLAELLVVPDTNVRSIPPTSAPAEAGAFTLAALTAWRMVVTRARVQRGENVLIWGIGGGVALAALQICKQIGARVWAVSSSDEKLERAATLGADELLNREHAEVGRTVRERTGKRGIDVVIDNVGKDTWSQSLFALGRRGRLVTCGATSGPIVETDVRRLFWNQWSILGSTMGNDDEFDAVVAEFRAGRLPPVIDSEFSLDDGRAAFERLGAPARFGKVVVHVS